MEEWNNGFHYFQYSNVPTFHRSKFSFIFRNKSPDRSVVSSLPFGGEETARELLHFPVIGNTFTAPSLPVTGFISAGAPGFILFDIALQHHLISSPFRLNQEGSRIPGFEGSSERMIAKMVGFIFFRSTP
jgi:hypothetical protein